MGRVQVALVLLTVCLGISSADVKTSTACEHTSDKLSMNCPAGTQIKVHSAMYGRQHKTTCSHNNNDKCKASSSDSKVKTKCNGLRSCVEYARNSVFGDPCRGVRKYLQVKWSCEPEPAYLKAAEKSNHCPHDSNAIQSENYCKTAAAKLGGKYKYSGSWSYTPRGCYMYKSTKYKGNVYWNKHSTGGAGRVGAEPICTEGDIKQIDNGLWEEIEGKSVAFFNVQKSWPDAQKSCESIGGSLIMDDSDATHTWLSKRYPTRTWVGGSDIAKEGTWMWVNGRKITKNYWRKGEPNNVRNEDCIAANWWKESGSNPFGWNDYQCHQKHAYACELTHWDRLEDGKQVAFFSSSRTWADAEKTCNNIAATLIHDDTDESHAWLMNFGRIWLGGSDIKKEGTFVWTDGRKITNNHWATRQPDNAGNREDCIETSFGAAGKWNDLPCTEKRGFACQKMVYREVEPGKKIARHPYQKNWNDAKKICAQEDATLVMDDSDATHKYIASWFPSRVWLGASDIAKEGAWKWVDGREIVKGKTKNFWPSSEPNNVNNEDCLAGNWWTNNRGVAFAWNDYQCSQLHEFACQRLFPVNGGWSAYTAFSKCSKQCGPGTKTRSRKCNNPSPLNGGRECVGSATETVKCEEKPCPIDGKWSEWSAFTKCPVLCGGGHVTRERSCSNPRPQHGGKECKGDPTKVKACAEQKCPEYKTIELGKLVAHYPYQQTWAQAKARCEQDKATLVFDDSKETHAYIGKLFPKRQWLGATDAGKEGEWKWLNGEKIKPVELRFAGVEPNNYKVENCLAGNWWRKQGAVEEYPWNDYSCENKHEFICQKLVPVNGGFSAFSAFSACTKKCGGGEKTRTRTCTRPAPKNGGRACVGETSETEKCSEHPCPINGGWGEYSAFSKCSKCCGEGEQVRVRRCNNPLPRYGGSLCKGESIDRRPCNEGPCPVNGGWTKFSPFTECSRKCGGGFKSRVRSCTNPAPAHGGLECVGSVQERVACNTHKC